MDELVRWFGEQLDEDEQAARAAMVRESDWWWSNDAETAAERHIAAHDPARVLREIDAKRVMVNAIASAQAAALDAEHGCCHEGDAILAGECPNFPPDELPVLRLLALPYADRPGYRSEWRP